MMRRTFKTIVGTVGIASLIVWSALAAEGPDKANRTRTPSLNRTLGTPTYQILNINNLWTWARRDGQSNHSPTGDDGMYYPRGTKWVIYQDGFMYGGKAYLDPNFQNEAPTQVIRVGGATYNVGTQAGRIIGTGATAVPSNPADADVRIFRIRRDFKQMSETELTRDAAESFEKLIGDVSSADKAAILQQYETDWNEWPVAYGAPYIERNGTPGYQPPPSGLTPEELISGNHDEPGVAGSDPSSPADQVVWTVFNDLNRNVALGLYGSEPLGLEIQMTLFGYKRTDAMGNLYFKRYRIINKGGVDIGGGARGSFYIDSMYVSQWSDPDLGSAGDDLVGVDSAASLAYVYNGNAVDLEFKKFNLPPPSSGYDFLAGPIVASTAPGARAVFNFQYRDGYENLPMTSFVYFSAGSGISDPPFTREGGLRWWKMLRGFVPNASTGPDIYYPHPPGEPLSFFPLNGDPVKRQGFIDGLGTDYSFGPGDRRIALNSGPFRLAPGDTQEVVIGTVAGLGSGRLSSVSVMKFNDRFVQNTFDALFQVPKPPVAPAVQVSELDGQVILEWGSNLARVAQTETTINQPGEYKFEGYNIYQLPSRSARLSEGVRVATYDLATDPDVVLDEQFDPSSGQILQLPVQFGSNSGVVRYFNFNRDYIRDIDKLNNGQEYYLAVTSYSVANVPNYLPAALESDVQVLTVRPQSARPGTRITSGFGDTITVRKTGGSGDATAVAKVIDPSRLQTATYDVNWVVDTVAGLPVHSWTVNKGSTVMAKQRNTSGDNDYAIFDGVQLSMSALTYDPPTTILSHRQTVPATGGLLNLWGDYTLFGGATGLYKASMAPGPTVPPDPALTDLQADLEFRFTGNDATGTSNNDAPITTGGQWTTQWARASFGVSTVTATSHLNVQMRSPFELWDIENNRQLNYAVINRNADAASPYGNDVGNPNVPGQEPRYRMTGRDYIVVIYTPYDPATAENTRFFPNDPKIGWLLFFTQTGASRWKNGDVYQVRFANPIVAGTDSYQFKTSAPTIGDMALAKQDAAKIGVFPNPYYAFNPAETSRLVRFVTFNFLPARATIRIFNLAGQVVRTLEKNDNSQFMRWDLNNQDNFPVASGMYIAYVELPDLGTSKVLKIAVIQEQEVLDVF